MKNTKSRLNYAGQLFSQQKHDESEQIVLDVLQESPANTDALNLLGSIAASRGEIDKAVGVFSNLTKTAPDNPQVHFNLGRCYQMQRNFIGARAAFEAAAKLDQNNLPAWNMLSRIYQTTDDLSACIDAAKHVLRLVPENEEGKRLALDANLTVATASLKQKSLDEAQSILEQVKKEYPQDARIHSRLGDVYREQDRNADAAASFLKAAALRKDPLIDRMSAAIAHMRDAKLDEAYQLLLECHAMEPDNQRVLSAYGALLWELGRDAEYKALFDYQNRILPIDVTQPPRGYQSMEEFHGALTQELRDHPTLMASRVTKSTTGGQQTGNIFANPAPAVSALTQIVNSHISDTLKQAKGPSSDLQGRIELDWNLIGWGVILQSQGYQSPHNHPSAMISGVYYIKVPDEVSAGGDYPGCIEFGPPNESYRMKREPERHRFLAQEGRMYLFPSHFWHRTIPFESTQERICIAFDANPKPQRQAG